MWPIPLLAACYGGKGMGEKDLRETFSPEKTPNFAFRTASLGFDSAGHLLFLQMVCYFDFAKVLSLFLVVDWFVFFNHLDPSPTGHPSCAPPGGFEWLSTPFLGPLPCTCSGPVSSGPSSVPCAAVWPKLCFQTAELLDVCFLFWSGLHFHFICSYLFTELQLSYNTTLVSGVQRRDWTFVYVTKRSPRPLVTACQHTKSLQSYLLCSLCRTSHLRHWLIFSLGICTSCSPPPMSPTLLPPHVWEPPVLCSRESVSGFCFMFVHWFFRFHT